MNKTLIAAILLLSSASTALSQTKVIAHRGYWNCAGSAQNSIIALDNSNAEGFFGSEFDVLMTKDGVLVVNHDDTINGIDIQKVNYDQIKDQTIANEERLPTLREYLERGKKHKKLKLIFEMKPHYTEEQEDVAVAKAVEMIKELDIESQVEYISFSHNICLEFSKLSTAPVAYLGGDKTPEELKKQGINGIDYHFGVLLTKSPETLKQAQELGVATNSWTINDLNVAKRLIEAGIDYITTDYPEEMSLLIKRMQADSRK